MKISIEAFLFVVAVVSSAAYANEEAEAPKALNLENCMPFCAQEIENIVFTTESLKSSMQSTVENLQGELDKTRGVCDEKDDQIEGAYNERDVWRSRADAYSLQMRDMKEQVMRKQQEVEEYRAFLDEKEKAKMDSMIEERDAAEEQRKMEYEMKVELDKEMQELRRENHKKRSEKCAEGEDCEVDDEEDERPIVGSKRYFQRVIENLEFTMESVLKSSHHCQHQLSQCMSKEVHPIVERTNYKVRNVANELKKVKASRVIINWCLLKHDLNNFWRFFGLGYSDLAQCESVIDILNKEYVPPAAKQQSNLPPEFQAAQAKAAAAGERMGLNAGMAF